MSRILDSLRKAEQQRQALDTEETDKRPEARYRKPEPGYFWLSLLLLLLACAAIVGGFLLLQQQLYGVTPQAWLGERLPSFLTGPLGI